MPAVRSTLGTRIGNRAWCAKRHSWIPRLLPKKSSVSGVKATLLMFDEMQAYAYTLTPGSA